MFSKTKALHPSQASGRVGFKRAMPKMLLVTVTLALISAVVSACASPATPTPIPVSASAPELTGIETYGNLLQTHTTDPVTYPQSPPVGGPHDPVWQNCGFYDQPVRNENAVHSMEHGAVWITYQPDLPAKEVEILHEMARTHSFLVVSPYPGLSTPVVVTAWGLQLKLESAEDERLLEFVTKYMQGPQTPELGAPCQGGIGTPS